MPTSLEKWQSVTQDPRLVEFFRGLFERLGVRVTDTAEAFTCHHRGARIEFEPALDEGRVDYTVEIQSPQVDRLAAHARAGELDAAEQYRVVSTLFTPATAATLRNPVLSHPVLRRLAGAEDLIHVQLRSPVAEEKDVHHTLAYAAGQWLVIPGLLGRPRRTYRMTIADALEYQRQVLAALKADRLAGWVKFCLWYRRWRQGVSTRP